MVTMFQLRALQQPVVVPAARLGCKLGSGLELGRGIQKRPEKMLKVLAVPSIQTPGAIARVASRPKRNHLIRIARPNEHALSHRRMLPRPHLQRFQVRQWVTVRPKMKKEGTQKLRAA